VSLHVFIIYKAFYLSLEKAEPEVPTESGDTITAMMANKKQTNAPSQDKGQEDSQGRSKLDKGNQKALSESQGEQPGSLESRMGNNRNQGAAVKGEKNDKQPAPTQDAVQNVNRGESRQDKGSGGENSRPHHEFPGSVESKEEDAQGKGGTGPSKAEKTLESHAPTKDAGQNVDQGKKRKGATDKIEGETSGSHSKKPGSLETREGDMQRNRASGIDKGGGEINDESNILECNLKNISVKDPKVKEDKCEDIEVVTEVPQDSHSAKSGIEVEKTFDTTGYEQTGLSADEQNNAQGLYVKKKKSKDDSTQPLSNDESALPDHSTRESEFSVKRIGRGKNICITHVNSGTKKIVVCKGQYQYDCDDKVLDCNGVCYEVTYVKNTIVLVLLGEAEIKPDESGERSTQHNLDDTEAQQSPPRDKPPTDPHTPENLEIFPGAEEHTETSDLQAGVGNSRYFFNRVC